MQLFDPQRGRQRAPRCQIRIATRWLVGSLCGLALASRAVAQPNAPAITWRAPADCPSPQVANDALHDMVGDKLDASDLQRALAIVTITQVGELYEASVEFAGSAEGARELRSRGCDTLAEAVLLVVALTIDPRPAASAATKPADPPHDEPEDEPEHQPEVDPQEDVDPSPSTLGLDLGVRIGGDVGSLPEPTFGPALQLGITFGALRIGIEGALWVPRRLRRSDDSGGLIGLSEAGARVCVDIVHAAGVRVGPCAAFAVGLSTGGGRGMIEGEETQAPWSAARSGVSVRLDMAPAFIEVALDLGVTVSRPNYTIDDESVFHPQWFGRAAVAMGLLL